MKLFYSPGTTSLAPQIVLREIERGFDVERVDLKTHRTASGRDFMLVNAKGDVPALQLDENPGSPLLTETQVILLYLADLDPERRLAPAPGVIGRYHLFELLSFIATEIHKPMSELQNPDLPSRYAGTLRGAIGERLLYLQDILFDRAYLMGETFSIADAYLFTMLQWCPRVGIDIQLFPNLDDYEYRCSQRQTVHDALLAEGLISRHAFRESA